MPGGAGVVEPEGALAVSGAVLMGAFNWHEERERDTFKSWALIAMLKDGQIDELREPTNGYTEVEFGLTVNGVAVDADKFFRRLEEERRASIEVRAAKLVAETAELSNLYELLNTVQAAARAAVLRACDGTPMSEYIEQAMEGW